MQVDSRRRLFFHPCLTVCVIIRIYKSFNISNNNDSDSGHVVELDIRQYLVNAI